MITSFDEWLLFRDGPTLAYEKMKAINLTPSR